jgi:probable F420-dependent oxidoreductase
LCRLAGEVADGFVVHPYHTQKYLAEVIRPAIEAGAQRAGRSIRDVIVSSMVFVAVNDAEREAARAQISFYASTPSYRPVLDLHGWGAIGEQLSALAARSKWDEMPRLIGDEMLEAFAVAGTWEDIAERLWARCAGLLDRVGFYRPFQPGTDEARWRSVAAQIKARA